MTLTIRHWPDPVLLKKCEPVFEVNDELRQIAEEMLTCMYESRGIGLAAPQVGLSIRMFVLDTGEQDQAKVFINPVLTLGEELIRSREGCLSLPGVDEYVTRSKTVHVKALGLDGKPFELVADDLLAITIQHENDHIDGLTMVERVGPATRRMLRKQLMASIPPPPRPSEPPKR